MKKFYFSLGLVTLLLLLLFPDEEILTGAFDLLSFAKLVTLSILYYVF